MKKSFMTRVLAVSLSAAMTFSLSAANMATASAASKNVVLSPSTVTLQYGTSKAKKTLKLKNNSLKWKVKSASVAEKGSTAKGKKLLTISKTSSKVVLKAKNIKKTHKATVTVKVRRTKNKKTYSKTLKCKVTVKPQTTGTDDPTPTPTPTPDVPAQFGGTATATSPTRVEVKFNQVVDDAALVPENFSVDAEGVKVTQVDKGDGRNIVLTLSGTNANTKYALSYKGLTVDGKAVEGNPIEFTTPVSATADYYLLLETNSDQVLADGHSNTLITCTVRDKDGNVYDKDDFVIEFKTNGRGHFTRSEVVTSKGQTTNTLISEALDKAETVKVTAQIVRAVRDTELGEEFKGVKGEKDLTMTPELVNAKYNPIASVESNYADRITLRFQDNVDDDFYKTNGAMDPDKLQVQVIDNVSPSTGEATASSQTYSNAKDEDGVVNLKEVPGEPKALHVLVNKPLTDGASIAVRVIQKNPETGKRQSFYDYFKLTDSQRPSLMSVEAPDRRTLRVTFSEAVLTTAIARSILVNDYAKYSADKPENYNINRDNLADSKWGVVEANSFTVGSGKDGDDDRNVVTIKLGKDTNGEYARFQEEVETLLSASNIGDWAAATDGPNNVMESDELYFTAPKDDKAPAFEKVEVQSPEQYLVTFNSPVEMSASYGKSHSDVAGITVANAAEDGTTSETSAKQTSVIQLVENGTNIGAYGKDNPIRVTEIGSDHTTYLIETTRDWSQVYGTTGYYNDNYNIRKYQLKIPSDAIVNINNGMKNTGDIVEELTANHTEMQTLDTTMPVADDLSWDGKKATVTFNEPVKVRLGNDSPVGLNKEGLTPSIRQQQDNSRGVQQVTATFHAAGQQEVTGTIKEISDSEDKQIVVEPNQELTGSEAGVDWNLTIRGISDDVGNTATVTKSFKVTNKTTGFKVAWASVSTDETFSWTANNGTLWNAGTTGIDVRNSIYVFVKFTGQIGNEAMRARNYTLNSSQLPTNVRITSGIKGYDKEHSSIKDSITIELPWNVASLINQNPSNVMLAITNAVESATGQKLEDNIEYQLPYNIRKVESRDYANGSDAIFGDDDDEIPYGVSTGTMKGDYATKVKEAIETDKYRKVILSRSIDTLDVNRPVDIELNGFSINKLSANFNDGATCHITNNDSGTKVEISELVVNTPNADWELNRSEGGADDASKITFKKVDIRRMPANTLKNWATIEQLVVNTIGSAVGIENESTGAIGEIVLEAVNKDGKVTINNLKANAAGVAGEYGIGKITVNSPVQINIVKEAVTNSIGELSVADKVAKDTVLQLNDDITKKQINTFSGKLSAVDVKKPDGNTLGKDELKDAFATVKVENVNDLKNAVISSLKSSATVSGDAVQMSDLAQDINKGVYGSSVKVGSGYKIMVKNLEGTGYTELRVGDDGKFVPGEITIPGLTLTAEGTDITVYIQEDLTTETNPNPNPQFKYTEVTKINVKKSTPNS